MPVQMINTARELRKYIAGKPLSPGVTPEILAWSLMPQDYADQLAKGQELLRQQKRKRKARKPRPHNVNLEIVELERMYRAKDPREK